PTDDHRLGTHFAFDDPVFGNGQVRRAGPFLRDHPAVDATFHIQATTEFNIATDHHLAADQRIDDQLPVTAGFAASKHLPTPRSRPEPRPVSSQIPAWNPPFHSPA